MKMFTVIAFIMAFMVVGSVAFNDEHVKKAANVKHDVIDFSSPVKIGFAELAARGTYVECPKQVTVTVTTSVCSQVLPSPSPPVDVVTSVTEIIVVPPPSDVPTSSAPPPFTIEPPHIPSYSVPASSAHLSTVPALPTGTPVVSTSVSTVKSLSTPGTHLSTDSRVPPTPTHGTPTHETPIPTPTPTPSNVAGGHHDVGLGVLLGGLALALAI